MFAKSNKQKMADYMGYLNVDEKSPYFYAMKHCYEFDSLKYDTDWNWLIQVYKRVCEDCKSILAPLGPYNNGDKDMPQEMLYKLRALDSHMGGVTDALLTADITPFYTLLYEAIQLIDPLKVHHIETLGGVDGKSTIS